MPAVNAPAALPFVVEFGQTTAGFDHQPGLCVNVPVLAGISREILFSAPAAPLADSPVHLCASGDLVLGYVTERVGDERRLSAQTQAIYRRVLTAARGRHLYRIWNYVPRINAITSGLENYRAFCHGRSLAFEAEVGAGFPQVLPSASAVGVGDASLSVVFIAGPAKPRHVENPEQVPAYRYPLEHGPRSPSFSRATTVSLPTRTLAFISGTAAIKGHQTVAPGALNSQLDCMLDNLRLIAIAAGLGDDIGARSQSARHIKVYLRNPQDFAATRARLESTLLQTTDHVSYLQADICRAALNVEIEVSIVLPFVDGRF